MRSYIKTLREWSKLAKPNKLLLFFSFFMVVLVQVCFIVAPIYSAKTTVSITNGKYTETIIYLCVVFGILLLRKTFWHFNYKIYPYLVKSVYNRINQEFIEKSLNAKNSNFKTTSKERILNMVHTDVNTVADFADKIGIASARLIQAISSIIIIFTVNFWAGLIVFIADILDFFVLSFINTKREKWLRQIRESNDEQYEKLSEIIDTRDTIKDLGLDKQIKKDYNKILDNYIYRLSKSTFWESMKGNYYQAFYEFLILVAKIVAVFLVAGNGISLELYFVIIAYVADGIYNTKDLYSVLYDFKNVNVALGRVKTVLNFADKEEIEVGSNNLKDILGSICFNKVSYKKSIEDENPSLNNFDVLFKENETTLIMGPRSCGKRTIFNMLRRNIKPIKGEILIDGVNLYDFTKASHRDNFSYVTTKPTFFKGSIIKNLTVYEKNRKIVYEICRELGIYNYIESLPKKFNTNISQIPYEKLYLLGLARAILYACEILVIYEFPDNLSTLEKDNIKNIINKMHGTRTILIFSAKDYCADISNKIIRIERGEIKSISFNDK